MGTFLGEATLPFLIFASLINGGQQLEGNSFLKDLTGIRKGFIQKSKPEVTNVVQGKKG